MSSSQKSHVSSKHLATVCKSNPSFFAKLTISANYQKSIPNVVDAIVLTVEYLQLYAQILLLNLYLYPQNSTSPIQLHNVLTPVARVLLAGTFFKESKEKDTVLWLFFCLMVFSVLKGWLLAYVCYCAKKGVKLKGSVSMIWNWIFYFQARVFYSFVMSFWVILIQIAIINEIRFEDFWRCTLVIIPSLMMVLELVVSAVIEQSLSYNLPTKRFLSRKASVVETITLLQKIMNQGFFIAYLRMTNHFTALAWISNIFNYGLSFIRDFYFFQNFPPYSTKALFYKSSLLVLTTCQSFAYLLQTFLRQVYDENMDPNSSIIIWIILGVLSVVHGRKQIERIYLKLVMGDPKESLLMSSNLMIHKIFAIKYFFKEKNLPGHQTQNYSFPYLVSESIDLPHAGEDKEEKISSSTRSLKFLNKYFVGHLENLVEKFPKNNLMKLILAWFYIRKLNLYGPGIRILHVLINSRERSTAFNASLLIYELEKRIKTNYKNEESKLDLGEYTKSLTAVVNLKSLILKQANLQIRLCSEISQSSQDLHQIFKTAQDIYQTRAKVTKEIKKVFSLVPEYYLEPYKICAHYHLNLNFSLDAYEHYEKLYERISHKYEKILTNKNLTQETLYNKNSNIVIFSGEKTSMGIIKYCSKGYKNFIQHPVVGTHIGTLCPQSVRKFYTSIINNLIEQGNKVFLEKIESNFYFNYPTLEAFPMQFYMNVVPYFTEGLHYAFISLPSSLGYELISFSENGEIESFTPGIGRSLNLTQCVGKGKMVLNIANISKELEKVNEAFNMIKRKEEKDFGLGKMTLEEAKEIYEIYLGEGEILNLRRISFDDGKIFEGEEEEEEGLGSNNVYRCKIIEVTIGPCYFRRLKLEKTENKVFRRHTDQRQMTGRFGPDSPSPLAKKGARMKSLFYSFPTDISPNNHQMLSEPSEYETGNEKETGWINLEPLASPTSQIHFETLALEGLPRLVSETNERLISGGDQLLTSTTRNFVPTSPVTTKRYFFKSSEKKTEFMSLSEVLESEVTSDDTKFYKTKNTVKTTVETQMTSASSSNTARLAKTLNEAINTPYRPISHRIFGGLIGLLFLSIIISQIGMKITMDNETINLETKKNVLRSAERRNYYLISINRRYRYLGGAIKGWYAPNDISPNAIPRILSYAIPNTTSLAKENARLMIYTRALEQDDLEKMYLTNVEVYQSGKDDPTPESANFTSFQATEQIVQASLKAITFIEGDYMQSKQYLDFIFRNSVNDLLVVGEITADLFLESMNSQTRLLKSKMTQNFIIVFGVFGVVGVISLILIYREYLNEVKNLTAFVKINKKGVAHVSVKLARFAKFIEDDVNFEDIKDSSSTRLKTESMVDNDNYAKIKKNQAKEDAQVPNSTKIGLKYRLIMAKEVIFLVVLMGLIALMISLVGRYIDILSGSLNQIHFLDRMIYKFDLAGSTYFDLLSENGTSYVRNHLTPIEFDNGIATVGMVQNSIAEQLQNHDGSYDSVIEGILFDNACYYLNATDAAACVAKQKGAETVSFIQLVSNLEAILISMKTKYDQSDKSIASLANLILRGQSDVSSSMLTITAIYQTMAERLDDNFVKEILHYQDRKTQMVIIIAIFTALVCWLKYLVIVKELQRNLYQFRNALKLFPPKLILSNFMLKTFLIKTTQGSFNWFKTDF